MSISIDWTNLLISLGGATGITYSLIKIFGNKILQSQFEKSLENYKFRINSKFDRISKIHEKEFEVLPKIWNEIIETNTRFYSLTSLLQQYPDINHLSELEIEELCENQKLRLSEKERIYKASDKMKEYIEIDYWKKFNNINDSLRSFVHIYQVNRIFLVKEFEDNMEKIRNIFIEMSSILQVSNNNGEIDYKFKLTANKKQDELNPIINTVGQQIQKRLCFEEAYER
jgi:hypothetical protein